MIFVPYLGLNSESRESSVRRNRTSRMSNGLRMSGFTRDSKSSTGYRGATGSSSSIVCRGVRTCSEPTHSRAFRIASNLSKYASNISIHNLASDEQKNVLLIRSHLVRKTCYHGMNFGTSQLLRTDGFSCCHFHQRWPSKICLALVLDEDSIIRQGWMVCASRSRRSEDNCTRRFSVLCSDG